MGTLFLGSYAGDTTDTVTPQAGALAAGRSLGKGLEDGVDLLGHRGQRELELHLWDERGRESQAGPLRGHGCRAGTDRLSPEKAELPRLQEPASSPP